MEEEPLIKVGDLVQLRKEAAINKLPHSNQLSRVGYGVVLDKIATLFIFPKYIDLMPIDYDQQYEYMKSGGSTNVKDKVETKICKVYWFSLQKMMWEYESDLAHISR